MAQAWTTGPVHIFVAIQSPLPVYLGTGEQAPDIDINPEYDDVFNDITGNKIPYDRVFEGEWAFSSVTLTRWNEPVYSLMAARPRNITGQSVRGAFVRGDLGTLQLQEGFAYSVFFNFPYSTLKTAMAGQPAGYRFPGSMLFGPDRIKSGTRAGKRQLNWLHLPVYSSLTGAQLLYDHTMAGLPNPD